MVVCTLVFLNSHPVYILSCVEMLFTGGLIQHTLFCSCWYQNHLMLLSVCVSLGLEGLFHESHGLYFMLDSLSCALLFFFYCVFLSFSYFPDYSFYFGGNFCLWYELQIFSHLFSRYYFIYLKIAFIRYFSLPLKSYLLCLLILYFESLLQKSHPLWF